MDEHDRVRRPPQETLPMLTTEHFTLQLAAQVSDVGSVFRGLALVLLPTVYVFGLVTLGRMRQLWQAWFAASQGMNRIRHFFVEMAPETAPYFVMPTTDEPWTTLQGHGIGRGADVSRWEGLYTAPAAVGILNSMVAAAFVGILTASLTDGSTLLPAILGAAAFALSFIALMINGIRGFRGHMTSSEVRFPPES